VLRGAHLVPVPENPARLRAGSAACPKGDGDDSCERPERELKGQSRNMSPCPRPSREMAGRSTLEGRRRSCPLDPVENNSQIMNVCLSAEQMNLCLALFLPRVLCTTLYLALPLPASDSLPVKGI